MPYQTGSMPKPLRGKNIPQKFADQWVRVFNKVLSKTNDEAAAFRQANGVLAKAMHKAGYRQGRDGKWRKVSVRTKEDLEFLAVPSRKVLFEEKSREQALEEGLTFTGTALVDHAVSQQGSGWERYYSPEANDAILQRSREYLELGHVCTIYNTHGAALGGLFGGTSEDPVGKVTEFWREGEEIQYRGFISPTSHGKDLIQLVYDDIRGETSIRLYEPDFETVELVDADGEATGETMFNVLGGYIGGIDFCDEAGIPGAGLRILESAPQFREATDMDEITLDQLKEDREDLVNAIVAERLDYFTELVDTLQGRIAELEGQEPDTEELETLKGERDEWRAKAEALGETVAEKDAALKLAEASLGFLDQLIYKRLAAEQPENPARRAEELRDELLTELSVQREGGRGVARTSDEPDVGDPGYPEDREEGEQDIFSEVMRLASGG